MATEPQGGTTTTDGGDQAGTQSAVGANGDASATPEQLRAEVERLTRLHQQSLAEKSTLENTKRENELLKQQQAEMLQRASTPPAAQNGNTPEAFMAQYAEDIRLAQQEVFLDPENSVKRLILKNAQVNFADIQNKLNAQHWDNELKRQRPIIEAAPKELRERAWELLRNGQVGTAEIAVSTARGEALAALDPSAEAERLRREREQKANDDAARASLAGKPATGTAAVTTTGGRQKVTLAEYNERVGRGERSLMDSVDRGETEIVLP